MSRNPKVPFGFLWCVAVVLSLLLISCMCVSHVSALFETPTYRLKTIVGSNYTNGIPATSYGVSDQLGSLAWKDGQLFFTEGPLIKKVDKNGNVYTIGGNSRVNSLIPYSGDSVMATYAFFSSYIPSLAVDPNNEYLYILDGGNAMIRRISFKTGLVSNVYFLQGSAYSLHILNERELLYSSSSATRSYRKLDIRTSNTTFFMNLPQYSHSTKYVNETLYALDQEMGTFYKVFKNGTALTLFRKDSLNPYFDVDSNGNVYFACEVYKIFRFNTSGQFEQIAGMENGFGGDGGLAINSKTSSVGDMVVNENDELIFADVDNQRIRKISKNGIISTIVGTLVATSNQPPLLSSFNRIDAFTFSSNRLFFSEYAEYSPFRRMNRLENGIVSLVSDEQVGGMVADESGALFYILPANHLVNKYNNSIVQTLAGDGMISNVKDGVNGRSSSVPNPSGIALYNNDIYVSSQNRIRIIYQNLTIDTAFIGTEDITSLFVSSDGMIYFLGSTTMAIHQVMNKTYAIRIIGGGTDTGDTVIQSINAQLKYPTSFFVTKTKEFIIGEESTIRISMTNGLITPILYVEEGLNNPPFSQLDNPKAIYVKESTFLEISFASRGNIFTLTRELNQTCYGVQANDQKICSGHGSCWFYNFCTCNPGFGGPNCELSICNDVMSDDPKVCNGRGQCQASRSCLCENGFGGAYCEVRNMSCFGVQADQLNVCSGNGICLQQDLCLCNSGFYGSACGATYCYGYASNSPQVCNNRNGNCTNLNSCSCKPGFSGFNCNITYCNDLENTDVNVCNSRGQCIASETCNCTFGYYGKYCQDFNCFGIHFENASVCSGRGDCQNYDACNCAVGSTGLNCEIDLCFGQPANSPQVCNYGNGTCSAPNQCTCRAGWLGKDCSTPFCVGSFSQQQNFTCLAPIQDSNREIIVQTIGTVEDLNSRVVNFTKFDGLSIKLPSSLSSYLNETNQVPKSDISIIASVSKDETKGQVLSSVITLSFVSSNQALKISQLNEPIQISFGKVYIPKVNLTLFNLTCSFYDNSMQLWNSEGLSTTFEYYNEEVVDGILYYVQLITCKTSHLTSFSVIDKNYKKANSEYKGMPQPSQLRNDLISLNNEQIIILATTLGGSFIIIVTVVIIIVVVIALVLRARRKRLSGSSSKSSCCSCCC